MKTYDNEIRLDYLQGYWYADLTDSNGVKFTITVLLVSKGTRCYKLYRYWKGLGFRFVRDIRNYEPYNELEKLMKLCTNKNEDTDKNT